MNNFPPNQNLNKTEPNRIRFTADEHVRIDHTYSLDIEKAYILSIPNNEKSSIQTRKCIDSCLAVGMKYKVFDSFDGTSLDTIKTPHHLKDKDYIKWIKIMDHRLTITEVCCAMGHLALWAHCISINRPIVILEHDAIMLTPYTKLVSHNVLEYLGHKCELRHLYDNYGVHSLDELIPMIINQPTKQFIRRSMSNVVNYNWMYPMGLHAYAIDPIMARRLFFHVMTEGLINPIDAVVRSDKFTVVQNGLYACQNEQAEELSTIEYADSEASTRYGRKDTFTLPGVSR